MNGTPSETDGKTKEDFIKVLGDDKDKSIVIYCGFVKCTRSHNGAAWAVKTWLQECVSVFRGDFCMERRWLPGGEGELDVYIKRALC